MRNSISTIIAEVCSATFTGRYTFAFGLMLAFSTIALSQEDAAHSIVQPGAPGQATKKLPATTTARLLPIAAKDVEFMQGMIHHHAQAVEMTAMIAARTENRDVHLIGARISKSQEDEIAFMKRWLEVRGQSTEMKMSGHGHGTHAGHQMLMPGMLSPAQMEALGKASGDEFDRLFLSGMIQHHEGALVMVDELFAASGAGQDAELFNFATDVDSGQRAEIKTMETLLQRVP
ncbi:MAG TPA: DUF305 domain-containing protein [Pyrinomonadaceae bacterium]|nr:DUF305 domain-containing protein [Pyrinomonadaceae bacterium]